MKRFFFALFSFLLLSFQAPGAETPQTEAAAAPAAPAAPAPGGNFAEIINTVRSQYPEEFDRILKLRETNPREAMIQGLALARKAGIELPDFSGMGAPGMPDMPGMPGMEGMSGENAPMEVVVPSRDFRRENMAKADAAIKEAYPEDFAKLVEMRQNDPEEARYYFRELASRIPGLLIKGKQQQTNFPGMREGNMEGFPGGEGGFPGRRRGPGGRRSMGREGFPGGEGGFPSFPGGGRPPRRDINEASGENAPVPAE